MSVIELICSIVKLLVDYIANALKKKIIKQSNEEIGEEHADHLAYRAVARMDFNNPIQMHRSLESYADIIISAYQRNGGIW